MLDVTTIDYTRLDMVKRVLRVTWEDEDTDWLIWEKMCRAEYILNRKLGGEYDYFSEPGILQHLYTSFMLYSWNDCESQWDDAYQNDILQWRAIEMVRQAEAEEEAEEEEAEDEE